jgi:hypothetical protein
MCVLQEGPLFISTTLQIGSLKNDYCAMPHGIHNGLHNGRTVAAQWLHSGQSVCINYIGN